MNAIVANAGIVLFFVLAGGFFAAAEIALVSLREGQVRNLAERGRRGRHLQRLQADPNRFLSSVQVGVTVAGFLSAAFGASLFAEDLAPVLAGWGLPDGVARILATVVLTLVIAYFSLVLGELVPKRLALQRAETVSLRAAPTIDRLAMLARPVIWLLSHSTNLLVRLVGGDPQVSREAMTDDELRELVAGHTSLTNDERGLIGQVFTAGNRQVREVLVPRTEVDFLDVATPIEEAGKVAAANPHSRYPVCRDSHDEVVGFAHVRDLLDPAIGGRAARVGDVTRGVKLLPASKQLLAALSEMRREGQHLAIVADEYGGTAGIVTLEDLVEELVGDIRDEYDLARAQARRLRDGEVEVDGLLNLEDFQQETGVALAQGPYETVAGYIIAVLGHLPRVGEAVEAAGHRLTVMELDGRRVARVRVRATPRLDTEPSRGDVDSG